MLACFPLLGIHAQQTHEISLDVPRIVPVSPEAAAMEKYQSYPIDYCTGIPNITIPLYEIVAGEITIPISLSYHASGLKPKERSGLAGTGWTLSLEPSIMREVKGVVDSDTYGWFNTRNSTAPTDKVEQLRYYNAKVDNQYDTQPDKFVYKLPHGGGSGYFLEPFNPMRCIPLTNDEVRYSGTRMDITDGSGVKYEFGGVNEKADDIITRWMCTAIRSPRQTNDPVTFEYNMIRTLLHPSAYFNLDSRIIINSVQNGSPKLLFSKMVPGKSNEHFRIDADGYTSPYNAKLTPLSESQAGVHYPTSGSFLGGRGEEARLSKINYFGNALSVSYKTVGSDVTAAGAYDRMDVTNAKGETIRSIEFFISLYNSSTSLTKLDSVRVSAPGVETKVYAFHYSNIYNVPSIYTVAVDHWGFCNGANNNTEDEKNIPGFRKKVYVPNGIGKTLETILEHSGRNREANAGWAASGILSRITDPQGIQTTFEYEGNYGGFRDPNHSANYRNYLHPVGGLRVKSIVTLDPHTSRRTIKSYRYGLTKVNNAGYEPIWGGGAIKHIVSERDYCSGMSKFVEGPTNDFTWFEYLTTYRSMPHSNITFNNGSAVMYNIVSEEISGDGMESIHTDYYYNVKLHNYEGVLSWYDGQTDMVKQFLENKPEKDLRKLFRPFPAHPQDPSDDLARHPSDSYQIYGRLIRKNCFKKDELVSRTDYENTRVSSNGSVFVDLPVRLISIDAETYRKHMNKSTFDGKELFVASNYYTPGDENSKVQTEFFLDVTNYCVLSKERTTEYYPANGRRDSLVTTRDYSYNIDFSNPGTSLEPGKVAMTNSNSTAVTDEYEFLSGFPSILSCHKHSEGGHSRENRILFKNGTCFPERIRSKTDQTSDFRDEVVYTAYDSHNNVAEIKGKDGTPITFLWGYLNRFPIAKIENATRDAVLTGMGYPTTSTNVLDAWSGLAKPSDDILNKIGSLREALPGARVTLYDYDPVKGLTGVTDPNGVVTHFEYDHYNRLTDSYYVDPDLQKVMLQQYIYRLGK
ncbi:MAG: RHS repeat protein [Parabacteroides sp.]|nr:RHS repeat protein [Parabacteroides sp.]